MTLASLRRRYSRLDLALVLFAVPAIVMAVGLATAHLRAFALLVVPIVLAALALRTRPLPAALVMVAASIVLRIGYVGIGYSTQVDHARYAAARVASGLSPYGVLLPSASAPPEPYVYGPLALLWWQPGVAVEFAAAIAVMLILVACRAWLTLALYAGLPFAVYLTATGVNDYSPGFLIVSAMLLLRTRPLVGAGVLAVATSVKPYAVAWYLPVIGYAGAGAAAALVGTTLLAWSPLLIWGAGGFVQSVRLNADVHPVAENTLNLPVLRWLAAPLSVAGLLTRRWDHMVLLGSAVFCVFLFLDRWASLGYWLAVLPAAGIAIESRWCVSQRGERPHEDRDVWTERRTPPATSGVSEMLRSVPSLTP